MAADPKDLATVLPFEEISSYFAKQVVREELRKPDLASIVQGCPSDMFSLVLNCAIRAKQIYNPDLDMVPLVPDIQRGIRWYSAS